MQVVISINGQIELPISIRSNDGIKPGQRFEIERINKGEYRLIRQDALDNYGLTEWLLSCPEKGYFSLVESESTDAL